MFDLAHKQCNGITKGWLYCLTSVVMYAAIWAIFKLKLEKIKIKSWMFLLVAKRLSNQQFKAVKSIMPVNQFFIKIFFKMYLSKLLPQKMHFQNCFFKKYITELAPQKKFFKNCSLKSYIFKSFPQKNLKNLSPQKMHFQNCFLKISIFKIAFSVSVCWEGTF